MTYLTLKAIHIVAVILWVGALCLVCFVTSSKKMDEDLMRSATRITDGAIGVTWLVGIVLVIMGGWYASAWWQIKVFLVIVISAIHSIFHRRWKSGGAEAASTPVAVPYAITILTLIIVLLVVFKKPA